MPQSQQMIFSFNYLALLLDIEQLILYIINQSTFVYIIIQCHEFGRYFRGLITSR